MSGVLLDALFDLLEVRRSRVPYKCQPNDSHGEQQGQRNGTARSRGSARSTPAQRSVLPDFRRELKETFEEHRSARGAGTGILTQARANQVGESSWYRKFLERCPEKSSGGFLRGLLARAAGEAAGEHFEEDYSQ